MNECLSQSSTSISKHRNVWSWVRLSLVLFAIPGCAKFCGANRSEQSPEQVVEGYLDVALNMTDVNQRDKLLQFTTGNLKQAIASVSDETIRRAYIDRKYEILSYAVIERRDRTPRETEITFQLSYKDLGEGATAKAKGADAPKVVTENTVSVVKEREAWSIRDVIGQKTSIDFPVSQDSRIEARPGDNNPPPPDEDGGVAQ